MHLRRCVASIRACLGPSGWGRFPGLPGAGDAGSIEARALPIDLVVFTQPTQHRQMQSIPYAGSLPISQTSPARHAAAEAQLLRQVLPRDAGLQHIQDAVERSSVIDRASPSALGRGSELRNQRFQRHPQLIADFASCYAADDTTFAASRLGCVSDSKVPAPFGAAGRCRGATRDESPAQRTCSGSSASRAGSERTGPHGRRGPRALTLASCGAPSDKPPRSR